MSKATQHFLNETENLFNTLNKLNEVKISVIDVSLHSHTIIIERPKNNQITDLGYGVVMRDDIRNELFVSMNKFKIVWDKPAEVKTVKTLKPKRKRWGFA